MKYSSRISPSRNAASCGALAVLCTLLALTTACTTSAPNENFNAPSSGGRPGGGGVNGGNNAGSGGRSGSSGAGTGGNAGMDMPSDAAVDGSVAELDGSMTTVDGSMVDGGGGEDLGRPDGLRDCGSAPVSSDPFTVRADLRAAAGDCAMWHYCEVENEAAWLAHLIGKHIEAPSESRLERVRDAWRSTMASWAKVELFQFGPLSSAVPTAGKDLYQGRNFRDRIYSWPTSARCRVEEQVVGRSYAENGFGRIAISARGLLALEYLLFYEGTDTACATSSATYSDWTALSAGELQDRKLAYAQAVASDVLGLTRDLNELWSDSGGNFRASFISATGYEPDEQEAMNVLGWSLMYVEKELKDWKMGVPAGRTASSPITGPESPYANVATTNWKAHLRGFRSLFQGCGANGEGIGFDDWLNQAGHGELSDDILSAYQNAQTEIDALGPLEQTSADDLNQAYDTLRVLTSLLKSSLLGTGSPLNLKLPATLADDTD
jgi:predicted lipoprotein